MDVLIRDRRVEVKGVDLKVSVPEVTITPTGNGLFTSITRYLLKTKPFLSKLVSKRIYIQGKRNTL